MHISRTTLTHETEKHMEKKSIRTYIYKKHTHSHTLHGWPTNLRFYSSSQLFGWLNCYKGTLLRSTVFARYILVYFVYGLWLTRLIRFAMFLLHGPTRSARIGDENSISDEKLSANNGEYIYVQHPRTKKKKKEKPEKKICSDRTHTPIRTNAFYGSLTQYRFLPIRFIA